MVRKVNFLRLLLYFFLALVSYFFLRVIFYYINYESFKDIHSSQILLAFFQGLRFDIATIFMINLPVFIILLLPNIIYKTLPKCFTFLSSYLFIFVNILNIAVNMGDSEYYKFISRRLTAATFVMFEDMKSQFLSTLIYYWKFGLGFLFVVAAFIALVRIINVYTQKRCKLSLTYSYLSSIFIYILFVAFTAIGIRSGFDAKPLSPGHAFIGRSYNEGNLVLNSTYTLFRSLDNSYIEPFNYFNESQDYIPYLEKLTLSPIIEKKSHKKNIVLIIMESFDLAYMSYPNSYKGFTPFLDALSKKSVFYINHYSNSVNSIGASLTLLLGLPNLMPGPPFVRSTFRTNKIQGIGHVLKEHNYETSYFHGGRNGTMYLNVAAGISGIDAYYGLDEYPGKSDYDGHWGIFDEPFFKFFADTISHQKEPFFSTIFSLSSHHPFTIPEKYKGKFPKGTLEIHESIGYADHALRVFFEEASKKGWYNNTLFIITADHSSQTDSGGYADILGKFRTPLIIYDPSGELKPRVVNHVTQHVDIPITVYSYLGIKPNEVLLFGQNILRDDFKGRALELLQEEVYLLIHDNYYMTFNPTLNINNIYKYTSLEPNKTKSIDSNLDLKESLLKEIKAFMQYYNNGLLNNDIYRPFKRYNFN